MATSHVACEFLGSGKICDIIKMTRECMRQMGGRRVSCMCGPLEDPLNKTVTKITFLRFHLHYRTQHDSRHQ